MDEEARGTKEMEAEGVGRYDGRHFFPIARAQELFFPTDGPSMDVVARAQPHVSS